MSAKVLCEEAGTSATGSSGGVQTKPGCSSERSRVHVSGDIPDITYLIRMVDVAQRNQHCQILCFTKKYELVNDYLSGGAVLPSNLHMILSAWTGLEMQNPFLLPEAHVRYRDGSTTARDDAKLCGGNCTECACTDDGCWTLQRGEQVIFNEH